jgi:hypothetical protein
MLKNGGNENENVILIDGDNKICFNEWNIQDGILKRSFQIDQNITKKIT